MVNGELRVSSQKLHYGTQTIGYELIYAKRKTLGIEVRPPGLVVVKAPSGAPLPEIEQHLRKRAPWILRHLRQFADYPPPLPPRQYVSGETHRYLGKQYRLKVVQAERGEPEGVKLERGRFVVQVRDPQETERVKRLLEEWQRRQAQRIFAERLAACYPRVQKYGIALPQLTIKRMEKRWGSCSRAGRITLNLKLIQVAKPYIDYVILHELCHLKEHNHSPAYYALLERVLPDWRERRDGLNRAEIG